MPTDFKTAFGIDRRLIIKSSLWLMLKLQIELEAGLLFYVKGCFFFSFIFVLNFLLFFFRLWGRSIFLSSAVLHFAPISRLRCWALLLAISTCLFCNLFAVYLLQGMTELCLIRTSYSSWVLFTDNYSTVCWKTYSFDKFVKSERKQETTLYI